MWLPSTAQQALHAVVCIAATGEDRPVRVDEIAAVLDCPRNYLSKTLHQLARAGILRSERGPRGGFRLAKPPGTIALADVMSPFQPAGKPRCLLGRSRCRDSHPCIAHDRWTKVQHRVDTFFQKTTIANLVRADSRARAEARKIITAVRHSTTRDFHGPVA